MQNRETRVLVVDDVETSRELLAEALDDASYQVEVVASGEAAIECVRRAEGDFDFIIMDQVLLGGIDGITATREINEWCNEKERKQIRTIVMTMYGDGESSHAALDAGAHRYVFRSLEFKEAVRDVIALIESGKELSTIEKSLSESFWMNKVCKGIGMAISVIDRTYRVLYANDMQNQVAGGILRIGGICWVEFHQAFQQKGPCPWCPVKPLFEGEDPIVKTVPLFKRDRWQHWQTGASSILDSEGQVIAALKWGVDVTEREQAYVAALTARSVDERLEAALDQIRMLGYSRARLYELSEDGTTLLGRKQVGGMNVPITEIRVHVEKDPYSEITLSSRVPVIHQIGEHGNTLFDSEINREGLKEWLDVPLWTGDGHRVGKISIDNKIVEPVRPDRPFSPRPITDEHFESLLTIASFAANAIWSERQYQRAVQESELLRSLAKEREEMFSDIAHQLKSPLTSMKVPTERLADGKVKDPDTVQEYYRIIASATEDFDRMVDDILNLKRIEAGAFVLWKRETSVTDMIERVVRLFRFSAAAKDIEIETALNHNVEYIQVDPDKMMSALQTLLENAVHFSEKGTKIIISTFDDQEALHISVQDEGYGIPEDELPHIFEKYFRGRIAEEKAIDGVGIGLTIAKHVVEQHGGRISFQSKPGKGSTFTIELRRNGKEGADNGQNTCG
jgi:signal transduction histidine kinase/DNA-binding response OmpR family regulator